MTERDATVESESTLVSAFIANANYRQDRNIENYINYGKKLLECPINKIIFFDETVIDLLPKQYINEKTIIIPIKKEASYLYDYKSKITDFHLNTNFPEKDTLEYMFTMCNKTEHIRNAIVLNPFKSSQFIWVDFGINHIFKNTSEECFTNCITNLREKAFDKIRIGSIWTPTLHDMIFKNFNTNVYKDILWFFAGGVFGGPANTLLKFADLTKQQCIKVIEDKHTLMWEVNIWYKVFLDNQEMFSLYACDHNPSIIENY
jgi:hypothetical protein